MVSTPEMILIHLRNFKNWIVWSWTYLWAFWFLLVVFVLYYLRGPLKISENIGMGEFSSWGEGFFVNNTVWFDF